MDLAQKVETVSLPTVQSLKIADRRRLWYATRMLIGLRRSPVCTDIVSAVAAIEQQAFDSPWGAASLAQTLAQPETWLAVAQNAHQNIVAYCLCQSCIDEATVLQMATEKGYRRQGLGKKLLLFCAQTLFAHGCTHLWLEVRSNNAAAIALYQQIGFSTQNIRKQYYPPLSGNREYEDAQVMRMILG